METVIEIENYLHTIYLKDYKKKQTKERCPINNNEYIIDKLKLEYLSEIIPFELELDKKIELKESKIHGLGVFVKQNKACFQIKVNKLLFTQVILLNIHQMKIDIYHII